MEINNIYVGNNIEVLKTFPDNSIDSVVTDPPYGLGKEPNAIEVLQSWITTGYHEVKGKGFMDKEWDAFVPQPNFWKEIYRVLKPGGYVLSFAGTRTYDWMVMAIRLAGFEIRDMIAWLYGSGFPKSHNISKAIDKHLGAKREVIGKAKGVGSNNTYSMKNGRGGVDELKSEYDLTKPSTDEAKQWNGWGTTLKPALEPIIMARKPLDGTVAQNVLKHGVGGINIDASRVPLENDETIATNVGFLDNLQSDGWGTKKCITDKTSQGRFPANVIHDGSDEVVNLFPDSNGAGGSTPKSKTTGYGKNISNGSYEYYGGDRNKFDSGSGSASRFFYKAKASKKERNLGLSTQNIHPTVKPIDLMRYLVRLVTPPNGICLDPYLGSGTTAIACEMEKFSWIGIELMPEYAEIAKARIGAVKDYEATL